MATLIAVYGSDGCEGRCDARCYEAEHDHCECICGGANHGVGFQKAAENTAEFAQEWLDRYEQETGKHYALTAVDDLAQPGDAVTPFGAGQAPLPFGEPRP